MREGRGEGQGSCARGWSSLGGGPEIVVQASCWGLPHKVRVGAGGWGQGGHSGRGPCRPATSGVSGGLWLPLEAVQSLRKACAALRCARRWVMEKPAFPSSCDRITRTCLGEGGR